MSGPLGTQTNNPTIDQGTHARHEMPPGGAANLVMTQFHPGVNHNHSQSGRWSDIQKSPNSDFIRNMSCSKMEPMWLVFLANLIEFRDKPIALAHLNHYLYGHGVDYNENKNIELWLQQDMGIKGVLARIIPNDRKNGKYKNQYEFAQDEYVNQDFRYAFGGIDIVEFEVDFDVRTIHVWFQDRYEWHPYYAGIYSIFPDDGIRPTNCLHAALVELKSSGAADYWMKGEATVSLDVIIPNKISNEQTKL